MALIKPIILDDTLQSLVTTQNQIKSALESKMYNAPAFSTATILSNGVYPPPSGYDAFNQVTVSVSGKLMSKTITSNGTYLPDSGYDAFNQVTVSVSSKLMSKTITSNGTYLPDSGYDAFSMIEVNMPVKPDILLKSIANKTITSISRINISTIYDSCFKSCSLLTSVSFPNCTYIGSYAFRLCSLLTSVSFPQCTNIDDGAFVECSSLSIASFPMCTSIGVVAFAYCSSLSIASFPNCTSICNYAFERCYNLISLYLDSVSSVTKLTNSNAFTSTPIGGYSTSAGRYGSIYVPSSLLESFKTATNWVYFSSRMVGV